MTTREQLGCPGAGPSARRACARSRPTSSSTRPSCTPPTMQPPGGPFYVGGENVLSTICRTSTASCSSSRCAMRSRRGDFEKRPLILGTNRDEGTLFHSSFFAMEVTTETEYRAALARRFGAANVDAIVAHYPVASFAIAERARSPRSPAMRSSCARRATRARGAARPARRSILYSFEREPSSSRCSPTSACFTRSEIPFVFGTDGAYPLGRIGDDGSFVADAVQRIWTLFARDRRPGRWLAALRRDERQVPPHRRHDDRRNRAQGAALSVLGFARDPVTDFRGGATAIRELGRGIPLAQVDGMKTLALALRCPRFCLRDR